MNAAPRQLHPAGILVLAVDALRDAALPMLVIGVVAITGGGMDSDAIVRALGFAAIGAIGAAIAGVVTWSTTTWALTGETVRLRTGVLSKKVVDIPLGRVQSVDTVRGPIQRLFGVQGVHVQTAGGGKEGEIKLVALAAPDVEDLRAAVGATRPAAVAEEEPAVVRRLGAGALLVGALTSGQVGVIVPVLVAVPQLLERDDGRRRRGRGALRRAAPPRRGRGVGARGGRAARRRLAAGHPRRDRRLRGLPRRAARRPAADPPRPRLPRRESTVAGPAGPGGARGRGGAAPPVRARRAARGGRRLSRPRPRPRRRSSRCCAAATSPRSSRRSCPSTRTGSTGSRRRRRARGGATCCRPRSPGWRSARSPGWRSRACRRGRWRSRCRAPRWACWPAGPPGGGWRATGSRCATAGSRASPCSRRPRGCRRSRARSRCCSGAGGSRTLRSRSGRGRGCGSAISTPASPPGSTTPCAAPARRDAPLSATGPSAGRRRQPAGAEQRGRPPLAVQGVPTRRCG